MDPVAKDQADAPGRGPHTVYVNTQEKVVESEFLTFREVVQLAFPEGPFGEGIAYCVLYHYKHQPHDRTLDKGEKVKVLDWMVFDVDNADRS